MALKKVLGLDIDFVHIKAAEVTRKGRHTLVTKLAGQPIPRGTVVDGKVVRGEVLVRELRRFLREQEFSTDSTVLGIRSNWITVKTHRLPKMPKRELDKALEFEILDLVSFPVQSSQELTFDYFINRELDREIEVVVAICPRQHIEPYIKIMREAGLTLESIDVPAFGWQELLRPDAHRAFIEVSEEQTTIQMSLDGVFQVLRILPLGTLHFRESVQEGFGVDAEQAEKLLASRDLDYLLTEGSGSKRELRSTMQQLSGSILQTFDFVRAETRVADYQSILDEVVFIGDLADLSGLGEMLQKEIDLPVRSLKAMNNLKVQFQAVPQGPFNCFGSALALGVRGLDL